MCRREDLEASCLQSVQCAAQQVWWQMLLDFLIARPSHLRGPCTSDSDARHALAVQHRIAAGVREMLELWFQHKPFPEDFYIVREGKLAEQYT